MHHAAGLERDDAEGEERAEEEVGDREEVAGPDRWGVVAQERRPRQPDLARRTRLAQVALNRRLGHADAQLEQFAADAFRPPQAIGRGHLADQGDRRGREGWAVRRCCGLGSPAPVAAKPRLAS